MVQELVEVVVNVSWPKAVYTVPYVDDGNCDSLEIHHVKFSGRVLRTNLDKVGRVSPYIATCSTELEEVPLPSEDLLRAFS